ncbi:NUDIX hydrolase [Paenibacillus camelliae]|uniref:NUDIX hydrolase n=1 Tax=Paenibacillus camelliae TaxID=512410 RepID=UPI00203A5CDC|nr:NUDIX hydrolase [Paenibacillus camelliae]MCM3633646.1 NUDIX hydrolase [Paenibacillus camelliae]
MFYVNARAIIERVNDGHIEIVIQNRVKPNEPLTIELPGGRIELYESLIHALRREVKEETGLDVTEIEGEDLRIVTEGTHFNVECVRPFAAFQTVKGPVDSLGYYFRCNAEGELLIAGDQTTGIRWMNVQDVSDLLDEEPQQFSEIDRAGIVYYLNQMRRELNG